ncbi:tRNA (adenosine(37)-N6)-threonylcarbamoyltransferase complex transferase subunit TsaD [Lewinella sp. 4G2]|uniref:tRNA (adenosine(37)-N6)-threonylcarbamoyltransferase complex transferase subunit TsaD n=1 Tax=Lewinella sp. 4G2 TaxID=1803372 RepID=UPI0007B47322|nr:tRNA (adenosine(37)-N6)-threonylcarbamoyltransferase complex transferase subunit TsaD [Lewinella sp. 4G2]OAV42868.1 tRNA N6-adenosine(37)-threonylcarbamoyltransferase complex transferase subunit TsaD [Lewinella sp. 4G2]
MPTILALESSCDDTSAAIVRDGEVLSNVTATQAIHVEYGGVVPEHASRAHQRNIVPTVAVALERAGVTPDLVDAVAFTRGPGLIGSLMVGVSFAKAFALARDLPLIEVDHMKAHVLAHFAEDPKPAFPFLCLTVSGGHTQLVVVRSAMDQEVIGRTVDDAAGEAFDKTGKMLGLDYPAGPQIDKLAGEGEPSIPFAEPDPGGLDFSFSGLKTSVLYTLQKKLKTDPQFVKENLPDICASIQHVIVSVLLRKVQLAVAQTGLTRVALAGGVSANSALRQGLTELGEREGWETFVPAIQYCTDNAAMIGVTATFKYAAGEFVGHEVAPSARL